MGPVKRPLATPRYCHARQAKAVGTVGTAPHGPGSLDSLDDQRRGRNRRMTCANVITGKPQRCHLVHLVRFHFLQNAVQIMISRPPGRAWLRPRDVRLSAWPSSLDLVPSFGRRQSTSCRGGWSVVRDVGGRLNPGVCRGCPSVGCRRIGCLPAPLAFRTPLVNSRTSRMERMLWCA